ncbi:hypothetical protein [Blastococcus saxobsidens]|uniref:Uncharacterized protein n=1 Tax=Blastococcus saxobsidens TaxID=138336 RepID=A0A4Q7Y534_9ACTN|nr:hypothetical protein [Blastococcus saxobsidens]RZU32002.1 hypothetical protein BKA19_1688 [Blastococcus saxobsidens]
MNRTSLPTRRWRSGVAAVAIAAASFTMTACGAEEAGEGGVIEQEEGGEGEGGEEEEEGY